MDLLKRSALKALFQLEEDLITGKVGDLLQDNPYLGTCWRMLKCNKKRCPSFGKEKLRCWQVVGTFCNPTDRDADFEAKWNDCRKCPVFIKATPTSRARELELLHNIVHSMRQPRFYFGRQLDQIKARFRLSPRECQVLALLANRFSRAEMARELNVSQETVKKLVSGVYRKMGVRCRESLVRRYSAHRIGESDRVRPAISRLT